MADPSEIVRGSHVMRTFLIENAQTIQESLRGYKKDLRNQGAGPLIDPSRRIEILIHYPERDVLFIQ